MGRPVKLLQEYKRYILDVRRRFPEMKANGIRQELRLRVLTRLKNKHSDLYDNQLRREVDDLLPGLSVIQKYLKTVKETEMSDSFKHKNMYWHLGTLDEFPISSEALPIIYLVKQWAEKEDDGIFRVIEAIWVSRLYPFFPNLFDGPETNDKEIRNLWWFSREYSNEEISCEFFNNRAFITTELDDNVWETGRTGGVPKLFNPNELFAEDLLKDDVALSSQEEE